jgi:hypothetical protein
MKLFLSYFKRQSLKILFAYSAILLVINSKAQQTTLYYDIVQNEDVIGHLVVYKKIDGNKTLYKLKSIVKAKFIFSYSSEINEMVVFENGLMIYSFFHETENGKEILNETKLAGDYLRKIKNGKVYSQDNTPISTNVLQLYTEVPSSDIEVFSNHFQQLINVNKIAENHYGLSIPGGHYNYYHYSKGVCTQIDVERTFFTIHIVLKNHISS